MSQLEEALAVTRAGLADERGIAEARTLYEQIAESERPASLAEYVASKPAELSFWMGGAQAATQSGATTTASEKASSAGAAATAGDAPAGSRSPLDTLRDARTNLEKAMASGDQAKIEAATRALRSAMAAGRS